MSLRDRTRRDTMASTQRVALEMFVVDGFDAVKVVDIAAAVDMSTSSLYRYFPTKEAIVLWEEHGDEYGPALADVLARTAPFAALRELFVSVFAARYDADAAFHLQRVRLMYRTPSVHAAAIEADIADRSALAAVLVQHLESRDQAAAELLASAAHLAADWALDRWQQADGSVPLATLVDRAFGQLAQLDALR